MARFQETDFLNEQPESKVKHLTVVSCPSCNDEECLGCQADVKQTSISYQALGKAE